MPLPGQAPHDDRGVRLGDRLRAGPAPHVPYLQVPFPVPGDQELARRGQGLHGRGVPSLRRGQHARGDERRARLVKAPRSDRRVLPSREQRPRRRSEAEDLPDVALEGAGGPRREVEGLDGAQALRRRAVQPHKQKPPFEKQRVDLAPDVDDGARGAAPVALGHEPAADGAVLGARVQPLGRRVDHRGGDLSRVAAEDLEEVDVLGLVVKRGTGAAAAAAPWSSSAASASARSASAAVAA